MSSEPTTYDFHREHLMVPFVEPVKTTQPTAHDFVSARTTVNAPGNKIGDTQIYNGKEYCFDGKNWFPVSENS